VIESVRAQGWVPRLKGLCKLAFDFLLREQIFPHMLRCLQIQSADVEALPLAITQAVSIFMPVSMDSNHHSEALPNSANTPLELVFPLSNSQTQLINDDVFRQNFEDSMPMDSFSFDSDYRKSEAISSLFTAELDTPVLNEIHQYLHLVASPSFDNIDALHEQRIRHRTVVPAEDPGLHLVWSYDTVFVKPIPPFLLNFTTWRQFLLPPFQEKPENSYLGSSSPTRRRSYPVTSLSAHCKAALGFLRTYAILVRHESDFIVAQRANLVPREISYSQFQYFIKPFLSIPASAVTPRYHYGQIRIKRLNWAVRLLQPRSMQARSWLAIRLYYQDPYSQSGDYVRSWGPALVFAFAVMSLTLSAMQVVLQALGQDTWPAFVKASWGFSVAAMVFLAAVGTVFFVLVSIMLLMQFKRAKQKKKAIKENIICI
jgi:hypothetical protein